MNYDKNRDLIRNPCPGKIIKEPLNCGFLMFQLGFMKVYKSFLIELKSDCKPQAK